MPPPNPIPFVAGSATRLSWFLNIDAWIAYLNSQISSTPTTVVNGSFELYTGTAGVGIPDEWVFTPFTGGSGALDNANSADGLYAFKIACPGGGGSNGGGQLDSYVSGTGGVLVPVNPKEDFWASWWYYSSSATLSNLVEVLWYTEASAFISKSTLWSASSGQPVNMWSQNYGTIATASIPSTARFYSLRFTGGAAGSVVGNVWYDNVKSGFQPQIRGVEQLFTSNGSFTPPTDCFRIKVKLWGGGGNADASGGGGGGAYCEGFMNVTPGVAITVTVGAVASSSVVGGFTAGGGISNSGGSGGSGGTASGGILNLSGQSGSLTLGGMAALGGAGGNGGSLNGLVPGGGGAAGSGVGARGQVLIVY